MRSRLQVSPCPHQLADAVWILGNAVAMAAQFASSLQPRKWRCDPGPAAAASSTAVRCCLRTNTADGTYVGCSHRETTRTVVGRESDHPCCPDPKSVPSAECRDQRRVGKTNPTPLGSNV